MKTPNRGADGVVFVFPGSVVSSFRLEDLPYNAIFDFLLGSARSDGGQTGRLASNQVLFYPPTEIRPQSEGIELSTIS